MSDPPTESAPTESAPTEPAPTDLLPTEPAPTDAAPADSCEGSAAGGGSDDADVRGDGDGDGADVVAGAADRSVPSWAQPASAGAAYLVEPDDGPGHGVLVLHSWWGLTPEVKAVVEALADVGYTALAPDLLGGAVPANGEQAQDVLANSDPNQTAALVLASIVALRARSADPDGPVAIVGFSMGASWGLWAATRQPESVDAVVAYYGVQTIDFEALTAPVLGHFAEIDPLVTDDDLVEMQAHLLLLDKHIEVHHYEGTGHWFAEAGAGDHHDPDAAALAWDRTIEFLGAHTPG